VHSTGVSIHLDFVPENSVLYAAPMGLGAIFSLQDKEFIIFEIFYVVLLEIGRESF
jgi:hypothetical protein